MVKLLTAGWKVNLARGVLALVFGVIAISWPLKTVIALAMLWGFWALLDGISTLTQAFQADRWLSRGLMAISGIIALLAALLAIFSPALTAVALTWVLGIWLILRGIAEAALAVLSSEPVSARVALALGALIDFVLGVLFATHPGRSAVSIAVILGITALVWGVSFIALAWIGRGRPAGRTAAQAPA